jgi:hypothetical protein
MVSQGELLWGSGTICCLGPSKLCDTTSKITPPRDQHFGWFIIIPSEVGVSISGQSNIYVLTIYVHMKKKSLHQALTPILWRTVYWSRR